MCGINGVTITPTTLLTVEMILFLPIVVLSMAHAHKCHKFVSKENVKSIGFGVVVAIGTFLLAMVCMSSGEAAQQNGVVASIMTSMGYTPMPATVWLMVFHVIFALLTVLKISVVFGEYELR